MYKSFHWFTWGQKFSCNGAERLDLCVLSVCEGFMSPRISRGPIYKWSFNRDPRIEFDYGKRILSLHLPPWDRKSKNIENGKQQSTIRNSDLLRYTLCGGFVLNCVSVLWISDHKKKILKVLIFDISLSNTTILGSL